MSEIERRGDQLDRLARLGKWLAASESGRNDPALADAMAGALRLYYVEALGLPPWAVQELSIIKGRLVPSAQLLRALADDAGLRVIKIESSDTSCTAAVIERATGTLLGETTFTIEDARRAGLVKPDSNWAKYPARMLWARASKFALNDYAPKVTLGMLSADEIEEVAGEPAPAFDWEAESEETVEWPGDGPSLPYEPPPAEPDLVAAVDPGGDDTPTAVQETVRMITAPQNRLIHAKIGNLVELERQAGLDPTDWDEWVREQAGVASKADLTREQARETIDRLDGELQRLFELTRP